LAANSHQALTQSYDALRGAEVAVGADGIITAPSQALDVFEFAPAAKKVLFDAGAPTHWGYLESGVDGNVTRDANHTAYAKYNIRVQRPIDARKIDTSVKIYSITSSAAARRVRGTSRPSALAVFILMTNSYLVGA
jgi:4-hydroxymandelate oxidase